jgi:prephenate dehydrogenase
MHIDDRLRQQKIAILGLGLIGGSLALALRGKCAQLLGVDLDPQTVSQALAQGVVDQASVNPQAILPQADGIILAVPVMTILQIIPLLPEWIPDGALVMDLGSTKAQVCKSLEELPEQFSVIGGHPMCGKEVSTLENAEASLFQHNPFVLVQCTNTSPASQAMAEQVVQAIGANPVWLDATTHDQWVAFISHFPYLIANALAFSTLQDAAPLASSGWRSTTRLAGSSLQMMHDILSTNTEHVLTAIDQFSEHLAKIRLLLASQNLNELETLLNTGRSKYLNIRNHGESP